MYEAIATGTPVVTVPLFADQPANAAALQHLGVGVNLQLETVTKETVLAALNTIINDTRYAALKSVPRVYFKLILNKFFVAIIEDRKNYLVYSRTDL